MNIHSHKIQGFLGVIGDPVQHSLSPLIHNYWLQRAEIRAYYNAFHVPATHLKMLINSFKYMNCIGFNVTIPHKQTVIPLLDRVDPIALAVGAVNTVVNRDGRLHGYNTDVEGFIIPLRPYMDIIMSGTAFIIGAGGAARAVMYALKRAGISNIAVMNRDEQRAVQLVCDADVQAATYPFTSRLPDVEKISLLVNTTSLGMVGQPALDLDLTGLSPTAIVYDLIYNPWVSGLLHQADIQGCRTINGLPMLVYQAQLAFQHWFSSTPEVSEHLFSILQGDLLCGL